MISKIVKGRGFRGAISYAVMGKAKSGVVRGHVIGSNMAGRTPRELASEFGAFRKLRPALGKAVFHASLSLAPGDRMLTDTEFADLGQRYLAAMGFDESPFVIIRHNDTEHAHIHLLACRINASGEVVSDKQDYKRAEAVVRKLETAFGLTTVTPSIQHREKINMDNNEKKVIEARMETSLEQAAASLPKDEPPITCRPFSPSTKDRRSYKRQILEKAYQTEVEEVLLADFAYIKPHKSGLWIYTKDGGIIVDRGDSISARQMPAAAAADRVIALAVAKGWLGIELTGSREFVRHAMRVALKSGLAVSPKDSDQREMLEDIMKEMGKGERGSNPAVSAKSDLGDRLRLRRQPGDTPQPVRPRRSLFGGNS